MVGVVHMPKGAILTIGAWSIMVASGILPVMVCWLDVTVSVLGATPNEQVIIAPWRTCCAIVFLLKV